MEIKTSKISDSAFSAEYITAPSGSTVNCNNYTKGCYEFSSTVMNLPTANSYYVIAMEYNSSYAMQIAIRVNATVEGYVRTKTSGNWNRWYPIVFGSAIVE